MTAIPIPSEAESRSNQAFDALLTALSRPGVIQTLPQPGEAPIIEALLDLHSLSGHAGYLAAAVRAGEWLRDVMAHGELYGVWL